MIVVVWVVEVMRVMWIGSAILLGVGGYISLSGQNMCRRGGEIEMVRGDIVVWDRWWRGIRDGGMAIV